jgi:hypothetical protein
LHELARAEAAQLQTLRRRKMLSLIETFNRLSQHPTHDLDAREVIGWWESRRGPFNLAVGLAGVVAIVLSASFSLIVGTECGVPDPPLFAVFGIFAYGVMANVCYTGGWVAELLFFKSSEARRRFGTKAFRWGFTFSVFITALPGLLIPILCIAGRITTGTWDTGPE